MITKYRHKALITVGIGLSLPNVQCLMAQEVTKPNIIFILTDDMGYGDVGVFFQNRRKKLNDRSEPFTLTPFLDTLAEKGATLTQYCAAPVCAPSRASLLTGVSQGHANVRDNQFDKALEDNYTLANVLQKAGYTTAAIGKWGLQGKGQGPDWPAHPLKRGFNYYYGYIRHGDGHEHYPKEGIYRGPKMVWENYQEVSSGLDRCYTGDLFTAKAKQFIVDHKNGKDGDKPFFIYLAYDTPHAVLELPTQAYPGGKGLKGGLKWIGKPGEMINTAKGKPDSWMHPDYADATYDHDKNPATPEVAWPDTYKRYATVTRRIDDEVGDIIQLLKDLKIDNNTLVVFTSDNGPSAESYLPKSYVSNEPSFFNSFGPFDGIKRDVLEGGVRTPAVAFWHGHIKSGTVIKDPSISYDWLPTFSAAAGLPAPARTDGVSLLPSLTQTGKQEDSNIYVEYYQDGKTPGYPEFAPQHRNRKREQMQMIRLGNYSGVRYNIVSAEDDFEIYNIVKDPQQKQNLASSATINIQKRMKEKVLQIRRPDAGAPRPYDSAPVPAVALENPATGLKWKLFKGDYPWLPQTAGLAARDSGTVQSIDFIKQVRPVKGATYVLEGYVLIPSDGNYSFNLKADGKAFFRIHEAALIDADYNYRPGELRRGYIILKAGYHPVRIAYKSLSDRPDLTITLTDSGSGNKQALVFVQKP